MRLIKGEFLCQAFHAWKHFLFIFFYFNFALKIVFLTPGLLQAVFAQGHDL